MKRKTLERTLSVHGSGACLIHCGSGTCCDDLTVRGLLPSSDAVSKVCVLRPGDSPIFTMSMPASPRVFRSWAGLSPPPSLLNPIPQAKTAATDGPPRSADRHTCCEGECSSTSTLIFVFDIRCGRPTCGWSKRRFSRHRLF